MVRGVHSIYSLTRPIRKGEPVMGWALAKEVRRKYPDMLIDFYESRLRVRSPNTPLAGVLTLRSSRTRRRTTTSRPRAPDR